MYPYIQMNQVGAILICVHTYVYVCMYVYIYSSRVRVNPNPTRTRTIEQVNPLSTIYTATDAIVCIRT